jgi:hypothetical protein
MSGSETIGEPQRGQNWAFDLELGVGADRDVGGKLALDVQRLARDGDEDRERAARLALAVGAVAVGRDRRLGVDAVADGAAQAVSGHRHVLARSPWRPGRGSGTVLAASSTTIARGTCASTPRASVKGRCGAQ